jgi:hypothetical protein
VNLIADIRSQCASVHGKEGYKQDDELQMSKIARDEFTQLLKFVESRVDTRYKSL